MATRITKRTWTMMALVLLFAAVPQAHAALLGGGTLQVSTPTATFTTANTLASYSTTVSYGNTPLAAGEPVKIQYTTSTGAPIGAPLTTKVGPGGVLAVPPPPIPPGAAPLGNKVEISYDLGGSTWITAHPLVWYMSGWIWKAPAIDIDPYGIPGLTSPQTWFIDEVAPQISGSSSFGVQDTVVTGSNFDVAYTNLGDGHFAASIVGDDSYMRLGDDTYLSLVDGSPFGTIDITGTDGRNVTGTYDFSSIGLAGDWFWDSGSNYTSGVTTSFSAFSLMGICIVPEPASLVLVALGGLLARRRP